MTMPSMCKKVVVFDLDDTLYKEIDFLKSGYRKVAELVEKRFHYDAWEVYERLYDWYVKGENPFACLNDTYGLDNPISDYLNVYRFHHPAISLTTETVDVLNKLKEIDVALGIITDGREITQKQKVEALGLTEWINEDNVFINENPSYFKPNHLSFDILMLHCYEQYPNNKLTFYYVGDNPDKDFIAPNELGWGTICLLDDGRNIHKQSFDIEEAKQPKYKISEIKELIRII